MLLLQSFSLTSLAVGNADEPPRESAALDQLSKEYNLKDVDINDIPAEVQPLVFNSAEELEAFLASEKQRSERSVVEARKLEEAVKAEAKSGIPNPMLRAAYSGSQTNQVYTGILDGFYIKADYTYYYDDFNKRNLFSNCSYVHGYLQGITIGNRYYEARTRSAVSDGGRSLYAASEGTMERYIVLQGIGKIYESYEVFSTYFYL